MADKQTLRTELQGDISRAMETAYELSAQLGIAARTAGKGNVFTMFEQALADAHMEVQRIAYQLEGQKKQVEHPDFRIG